MKVGDRVMLGNSGLKALIVALSAGVAGQFWPSGMTMPQSCGMAAKLVPDGISTSLFPMIRLCMSRSKESFFADKRRSGARCGKCARDGQ